MTTYYFRKIVTPENANDPKICGVYRKYTNPDGQLALEKYGSKGWEDFPPLMDASGIGGDHDYFETSEDEALAYIEQLPGSKSLIKRIESKILQTIQSMFRTDEKEFDFADAPVMSDAKNVMPRKKETGGFITQEGRVIFIGGPGSGGGSASSGAMSAHAQAASANRYGMEGEVGFAEADPKFFSEVRDSNVPPDKRAFVTTYTPEEYAEMGAKTYLSETGKSGYAVKPDGDIISVFSSSGSGEGKWAINSAIMNGGSKLDCFDGFLSQKFYPSFGFKEYDRWTWNDEYAPSGWDYEKYGRPSVILMKLER